MGTLSEHRKSQIREAARAFKKRQVEKGLYQTNFWMTPRQAHEVREWLYAGGDIAVFRKTGEQKS